MGHSKRRHEGYLLIDHRAGPGVSAAFAQQAGPDAVAVGEGQIFESATITCVHCHVIVVLNPQRTRARGYCAKCDHYLCDGCTALGTCRPMNQLLDTLQNAAVHALGKG